MYASQHHRPRRATVLAGLALALAPLAACGSDGSSADDAPATTTTAGPDLAAALLTPADLSSGDALDAGWAIGDVAQGVDIEMPACILEEAPDGALASAEQRLVTQNDLKLPSLEEDLAGFDGDGAKAAFDAAAARLDACQPDFVFQGAPAVGQISRIPLELPGTESAAWRTTVQIAGVDVSITNMHITDGDRTVALTHVDLTEPDPAVLQGYATAALDKLGS